MKDYVAHFRNTPGYTDLFDAETRANAGRLALAVQNGGFRRNGPLYAKKLMLTIQHPLIRQYGGLQQMPEGDEE
jgi:flagellum-specific peptidoglycan hydrolase FlgJ